MVEITEIDESMLARPLAPEDICPGVYVMVLQDQHQYPCGRCNTASGDPEFVIVEIRMRPDDAALPRKVIEVCLPYLVVENAELKTEIIDIRAKQLARVPDRFALAALLPHKPKPEDTPCHCKRDEGPTDDSKHMRRLFRKKP